MKCIKLPENFHFNFRKDFTPKLYLSILLHIRSALKAGENPAKSERNKPRFVLNMNHL